MYHDVLFKILGRRRRIIVLFPHVDNNRTVFLLNFVDDLVFCPRALKILFVIFHFSLVVSNLVLF